MNRPSSVLAAKLGIRQAEASLHADACAMALDRAAAGVWRQLLAVLRTDHGYAQNHARALAVWRQLAPALDAQMRRRLDRLARWGWRSAARAVGQALPRSYLRRAAVSPVRAPVPEADGAAQVALGFTPAGLAAEPAVPDSLESLLSLLFPPPSQEFVDRVVFAPSAGQGWRERLAGLSRLAPPEVLANQVALGMAQGRTQAEIARALLPAVDRVRSSARRVARTEGLRVASAVQMAAHQQLGSLVIGYQIHATLDENTRPWHAARSGEVYYLDPKPDQKGPRQMPHPPEEAEDPGERPAGTPQTAPN